MTKGTYDIYIEDYKIYFKKFEDLNKGRIEIGKFNTVKAPVLPKLI